MAQTDRPRHLMEVTATPSGYGLRVVMDGQDISNSLRSVSFSADAGSPTEATLTFLDIEVRWVDPGAVVSITGSPVRSITRKVGD